MSVKQQVARGVVWTAIERFSTQGIQFVLTIVIARLLLPSDYGLVAMLGIFMAVAQSLTDSGFSTALIQRKNRTEADYSTVFYFNIAVSCIIYLLLFFTAPLIAGFYNQPILVRIVRVFGLGLIINSFSVVQIARLSVELNFKLQTKASLISVLIGGSIGVWMAYSGYGVWTLVYQSLISSACSVIALWLVAHWKPAFLFSPQSFFSMFSYGSKVMLSGLLHTIYKHIYSLVVGKAYDASALGFFNRAYTLGQFPNDNFSYIVQKVLFPIQCRYQDDEKQFNHLYIQNIRFSCFVIFPVMVGMAVLADSLIMTLLTEKWRSAVPFLQIVCMAQMWDPIMRANALMLNSKGRSDYQLKAEVLKKIIAFALLFASVPFGIYAVCYSLVLYAFIDMGIIIWFSRKVTNVGYLAHFKSILPFLLLTAAMGIIVWLVSLLVEGALCQLFLGTITGVLSYVALAHLFKFPELVLLGFLFKRNNKK